MNEHDSERIAGLLETDGYARTEDAGDAEVVVLNTCAVRENADNRLYGSLGHLKPLKERNPRMRIVVAGCLAQKDQGLIQRKAPWVDVVVGTHALPSLLELIRTAERDGPQVDVREYTEVFPSALPARRESSWHAWVSVSVGCDNHCTFCIVPLVRGPQLSRPLGDVLAEVQGLTRQGVVEVTLLGQNVNTYGRDITVPGSSRRPLFADLLRVLDDVEGLRRIRFTSPHPHDFTEDVIEAMAECQTVCEHIHFPLQSGSDRILRFDAAFTFQYSPRAGTAAATFEDQVPKQVVQDRFDRLCELQERISLEANQEMVGQTCEVLVEGEGRKGNLKGRTRTNKLVHFAGDVSPGTFLDVAVTGAHPHHMDGELVRDLVEAAPRSRRGPPAIEPKASERGWRRQQPPPR